VDHGAAERPEGSFKNLHRRELAPTACIGANYWVGAILRRHEFFCRLENSFKKLASASASPETGS
jgi:hypothetical protein